MHRSVKKWLEKSTKGRSQISLIYMMAGYLAVSTLTILIYGFFFVHNTAKETILLKQSTLNNKILSITLMAEKEILQPRPNFSRIQLYADTLPEVQQVWVEDVSNNILYSTNGTKPNQFSNQYHTGSKQMVFGLPQGIYVKAENLLLYSLPLSNNSNILFAVSPSALETPPYYTIYIGVSFLFLLAALLAFLFFRSQIYLPVSNVEKAISSMIEGEMTFESIVEEKNQLYPLSQDVNVLNQKMQAILNRELNSRILRKQSEINALQSQINPHFLYNTLDSIRGQAIMQNSYEISNLLKLLSNIFRYSISKTSDIVPLKDELAHMENYLTIQQFRFNNKFDISIEFEGDEEELLTYKIPKLTIQPIVENAVFHGLETVPGKGNIRLLVYRTEKRLIINIQDDGIGIESDKLNSLNDLMNTEMDFNTDFIDAPQAGDKNHSSIALTNVNQRIRLLYGVSYGLKVFSTAGSGTMVQITLPLIS